MGERYVVGKDFNTKDWFVYDNETDKYICFCDTEEEAEEYVTKICKEMIMNILDEDMDKRESEAIKMGNGECEYFILPGLCGCQPGECGGYEDCDEVKCPQKEKWIPKVKKECRTLEKLVGRRYANLELLKNDIELRTKRNVKSIIESTSDRMEECDFMIDFCYEDNEWDIDTIYYLRDNAGQYYITEV